MNPETLYKAIGETHISFDRYLLEPTEALGYEYQTTCRATKESVLHVSLSAAIQWIICDDLNF